MLMQPWNPESEFGWTKFRQLVSLLTNRDISLIGEAVQLLCAK